eukprot:434161-Prymnesium_polylepis.1
MTGSSEADCSAPGISPCPLAGVTAHIRPAPRARPARLAPGSTSLPSSRPVVWALALPAPLPTRHQESMVGVSMERGEFGNMARTRFSH